MTLVAGKRRSLLATRDDYEVYDKKPQRYTPKTTLRGGRPKSEAYVTIIKDSARVVFS